MSTGTSLASKQSSVLYDLVKDLPFEEQKDFWLFMKGYVAGSLTMVDFKMAQK